MSATEAERHHLYEVLKSNLGAAPADTLMNLIPPTDWSDIATKSDIERRADGIDGRFVAVNARLDTMMSRLAETATRDELRSEIAAVRVDVAEVRSDLLRTLGTWLFASQAVLVAAVAAIVSFIG